MARADVREPAAPGLAALALLFLRLGLTAFGGPAAHIALMERECVRRRQWLTQERFIELLGAANLIPGPSSSELAVYIGYEVAGWAGLMAAGACFVLPAALLTTAIAWAYVRSGALPQVGRALYGVKPVVIAVVVQALVGLAPKAVKKSPRLAAIGALAAGASALGASPLAILVVAGLVAAWLGRARRGGAAPPVLGAPMLPVLPGASSAAAAGAALAAAPAQASLVTLFLTFLKLGSIVYGSGYVLLAFLRADFVDRLHWLSEAQLLDAVAVGQVTPGPVFTAATFIGFVVRGPWGALLGTVGIFLPGFVFVAATRPLLPRVRRSPGATAFLDGVSVASLGLMAVVSVQLLRAAVVDLPTLLLAAVSGALLLLSNVGSTWLILGGALAGIALHRG